LVCQWAIYWNHCWIYSLSSTQPNFYLLSWCDILALLVRAFREVLGSLTTKVQISPTSRKKVNTPWGKLECLVFFKYGKHPCQIYFIFYFLLQVTYSQLQLGENYRSYNNRQSHPNLRAAVAESVNGESEGDPGSTDRWATRRRRGRSFSTTKSCPVR
jgi:hypothetical protein